MAVVITNELPEGAWRRFVDQHPEGNIFHTPEMFQVFSRAKGYQPELWAALKDGQIRALLLPVRITLFDNLLRILTTRAVVYGSILCTPDSQGMEALRQLLPAYVHEARGGPLFTELRNRYDLQSVRAVLRKQGFVYEDHLNYLIDLSMSPDRLFHMISKSGRKAINRSIRAGVVAEEIQDAALIPEYYALLQNTFKRARVPLADISLFEAVREVLVPKGMAKMFLARVDNRHVAASLELPYKKVIFSWFSGYDPRFRSTYSNDYLVWNILQWGARNSYRHFDFGGAGRPDQSYGPRDFKAKFGGQLVNYGRNTYIHSPLRLRLSSIGYQLYRRIL